MCYRYDSDENDSETALQSLLARYGTIMQLHTISVIAYTISVIAYTISVMYDFVLSLCFLCFANSPTVECKAPRDRSFEKLPLVPSYVDPWRSFGTEHGDYLSRLPAIAATYLGLQTILTSNKPHQVTLTP
jgi:hypothetical protein